MAKDAIDSMEASTPGKGGVVFEDFEGARVPIEVVEMMDTKSDYDEKGDHKPGLQRDVKVLRIKTAPVTTAEDKEGNLIEFRASELFNLNLEDGEWKFSPHPKAKIQKLLAKCKVSHPKELGGKMVTVTINEKGDKQFFGIVM